MRHARRAHEFEWMPAVAVTTAHLVAELHVADRAEPDLLGMGAVLRMAARSVRRDRVRPDVVPRFVAR